MLALTLNSYLFHKYNILVRLHALCLPASRWSTLAMSAHNVYLRFVVRIRYLYEHGRAYTNLDLNL